MTEPTELLPCPFCRGAARHLPGKYGYWIERVICDACHFHLAETGSHTAVERWNTRTPQPTQAQAGAVPLTDEQIAEGFAKRSRHIGLFAGGVRFAEQHHGIKGGQHVGKVD